jgi:hypothetical protein
LAENLTPNPGEAIEGAQHEINDQEGEDGAEPPRVIHVKEVKESQDFIEIWPIVLEVFGAVGILLDDGSNDGKDCKQDEQEDGESYGTEQIKENGNESLLGSFDVGLWRFHEVGERISFS